MNSRILPIAMAKQHNILHILLPLLLLLDSTLSFSVPKQQQQQRKSPYCTSSLDCPASHCCTETPIGHKLCVPYERQGETCFFRSRSPVSPKGSRFQMVTYLLLIGRHVAVPRGSSAYRPCPWRRATGAMISCAPR